MVRIRINVRRHITTLILTACIFIIGLLLGLLITSARISYIQNIGKEQRLEYDSLQLQYLYISELLQEQNCPALLKALEENINALEKTRVKLEEFIGAGRQNEDYLILKREYSLAELRYWLLAKQTKEICKKESVSVLYFYSNDEECPDCETQGLILTALKDELKDKLLIFSLDANFEEPLIAILKESYNITELPAIIIENKKLDGFIKKDELKKEICSYFKTKIKECE